MPGVEGETLAPPARRAAPLGMVLFLASELMFFGGLFAAYFTLRSLSVDWPPAGVELDMPPTIAATVLLTASSFTMHAAVSRKDRVAHGLLFATFALGVVFLAIKMYELSVAGFGIGSGAYGSMFFTLLGAHGVHLVVGLALIAYVLSRAGTRPGVPDAVAYYWHFVDAVWLAIFGVVYLIR